MNIKVNPKLAWKYIKSKYKVKKGKPLPDIENKHIEHAMHRISIHKAEIGKLLSQLKINKSCGPDGYCTHTS